jgi:hypothetical protein
VKNIYVNTEETNLDSFLKFCYSRLITNSRDVKQFNKEWKYVLKNKLKSIFENSVYIIINEDGEYVGHLDFFQEYIKKGLAIWNVEDIELLGVYDEEYFDFDKWDIIDDDKYVINRVGFDKNEEWVYIEIENKFTHYRNFLINLTKTINIKKYIRCQKIKNLLNNI